MKSPAKGKIELAIARMAARYPFHAGLLSSFVVLELGVTNTMAVGFKKGKIRLSFNPEFVEGLTFEQLIGVLHHEVNHVIFGHCQFVPEDDNFNPTARTLAEEVTVNEWVPEELPGDPPLLEHFCLPPNESTEQRYQHLLNHPKCKQPETVDDHSLFGTFQETPVFADIVVAQAMASTWQQVSPKDRNMLPPQLKEKIEQQAARSVKVGEYLSTISWQQELRRYVGKVFQVRPTFSRPPRRFPKLVGILPGRHRQRSKPKIMTVIDTSGSVNYRQLSEISAELLELSRSHEITVVECDRDIQRVYQMSGPIRKVEGRGGTDFRPPFKPEFLAVHRPDLIIYATDGKSDRVPEETPVVPVIWLMSLGIGKPPTKWGRVIRMG